MVVVVVVGRSVGRSLLHIQDHNMHAHQGRRRSIHVRMYIRPNSRDREG